jgi:hypothetical protein
MFASTVPHDASITTMGGSVFATIVRLSITTMVQKRWLQECMYATRDPLGVLLLAGGRIV